MLQIKANQLSSLEANAFDRFVTDCAAHLKKRFPDDLGAISEDALSKDIRAGISDAKRHRIEREIDVVRFMEIRHAVGHDFESNETWAWIVEILNGPETAVHRLDAIIERFAFGGADHG